MVNMPHKYETKKKKVHGSMKNETLALLVEFFEEPNRKLATMLNDTKFLWSDFKRRYHPKMEAEKAQVDPRSIWLRNRMHVHPGLGPSNRAAFDMKRRKWEELRMQQADRMRAHRTAKERERIRQIESRNRQAFLERQRNIHLQEERKRKEKMRLDYIEEAKRKMQILGFQVDHLHQHESADGEDEDIDEEPEYDDTNGKRNYVNKDEETNNEKFSNDV